MSTAVKVELFLNATWTDVTAYARQEGGIAITQGVRAESGLSDASTCTLAFTNTDGRFSPRNTAGAYYPYLTRNTPLRVSVNTVERFRGEVPEWPTRWNQNKTLVVTAIVPSGVLRRLARAVQLDSTLKSATRSIAAVGHIIGYWPVEDFKGSTSIASGLPAGTPGAIVSGAPIFGASDPGVMSRPIATWKNASASFQAGLGTGAQQFTAGFLITFPATGQLTGGEQLAAFYSGGSAVRWNILYSPTSGGNVLLQVFNSAGAQLIATNGPGGLDGLTVFVKLEVIQNGANVDWALSATGGPGGTVTGSLVGQFITPLTSATIGGGTLPSGVDVPIGHLVLGDTNSVINTSDWVGGYTAYAGETITQRLTRLASQSGIAIAVTSATYNPAEMGVQPDGSLLEVLRAAEKADAGGILRDSINVVGLAYITRAARYNDAQPAVALNYATKQIMPPLEPTDDDLNLRNDVTVNRLSGSSARATKTSGALSSANYPAGVGPYPFEDTYAIWKDAQTPYLAQWLLALGTIDETRWPAVTVDLMANPTLVASVSAARPGSPLVISNLPAIGGTATATLQIIGWTENVTQHQRTIMFNCVPGNIYHVFQLDSSTFGRLNTGRLAY